MVQTGTPKWVIFEIATKHFRESGKQSLLNRSLRVVLDATSDIRLETIQDSFVRRSSIEKYLAVGLLLSEVLAPLSSQTLQSVEDTHASLFYRFQVVSDALNKAVQALQEWAYPG